MAKSKVKEQLTRLECSECKNRNYYTHKNKKSVERKLEYKKFCKFCRKQTLHKEGKK
ncbi:50S ribosomal protein L33 [Candidatus Jorgensenbacteria bacterium GWA1_54_12]|uniref:Large ribosomal subunit protein bL33 n=1 Tax=Candidatus Jorgensenbacteria bacterium GWA1_54_12 TaxID=1798468 RepID=A0A1F6BL25_9BACT|nr:MAG: 50S ribosomal protein L33 [Candidatus Jorgensenbacteria bacterium GWA1_54_12]